MSENNSRKCGAGREDDASALLSFFLSLETISSLQDSERKVLGVGMEPGEETYLFCFPFRKGREGKGEGKGRKKEKRKETRRKVID